MFYIGVSLVLSSFRHKFLKCFKVLYFAVHVVNEFAVTNLPRLLLCRCSANFESTSITDAGNLKNLSVSVKYLHFEVEP